MKTKLLVIVLLFKSAISLGQCWQSIACGNSHTLAIKSDGTLWAWGGNNSGQIGDGTIGIIKTIPTQIGTLSNWQKVAVGQAFSVALKTDGTLWTWGNNADGQLGDGTIINKSVPTQIGTATNWQNIEAAVGFVVATKTNGTLWTWGDNQYGQLGDGTLIDKNVPTQIGTATNWNLISATGSHVMATKSTGTLWTWGRNNFSQLGDGTTTNKNVPTQIGTGTNWFGIAAGGEHSIAIKFDTTLWAWGNNSAGQVGDGTFNTRSTPTQIGITTGWFVVKTGNSYSMALKSDGTLWAWGYNFYGQIGVGNTNNQTSPIQIGTETDWYVTFDGGFSHTVALKSNGSLRVWGSNNSVGLLGNSSNNQVNSPITISCPTSLSNTSFDEDTIEIYPNPTSNSLYLNSTNNIALDELLIYDLTGKILLKSNQYQSKIDVSDFQKGMYMLQLKSDQKTYKIKFIKN